MALSFVVQGQLILQKDGLEPNLIVNNLYVQSVDGLVNSQKISLNDTRSVGGNKYKDMKKKPIKNKSIHYGQFEVKYSKENRTWWVLKDGHLVEDFHFKTSAVVFAKKQDLLSY